MFFKSFNELILSGLKHSGFLMFYTVPGKTLLLLYVVLNNN